jgi:hypothetical protein
MQEEESTPVTADQGDQTTDIPQSPPVIEEPKQEAPVAERSGKEIMMSREEYNKLPADAVDTTGGALVLKSTGDSIKLY